MGYHRESALSLGALLQSLVKAQRYDEMPPYMQEYENSWLFDESGQIRQGYELYYFAKGMYYLYSTSKVDSAEICLRNLQQNSHSLNDSLMASGGLLQLYKKKKVSDSGAKYADLRLALENSAYDGEAIANMQRLGAVYNYALQERIAMEKKSEAFKYGFLSLVSLSVISILMLLFWNFRERKEKVMNRIRNDYQNMRLRLLQTNYREHEILALNQRILEMESKHPFLVEERLMQSPVYSHFKSISTGAGGFAEFQDFKDLRELVNKEYPFFRSRLYEMRSDLSPSDYELCILTRLHFSNSEISNIYGKSSGHVSMNQKRLMDKLFGVKGTPKDLEFRLTRIC